MLQVAIQLTYPLHAGVTIVAESTRAELHTKPLNSEGRES